MIYVLQALAAAMFFMPIACHRNGEYVAPTPSASEASSIAHYRELLEDILEDASVEPVLGGKVIDECDIAPLKLVMLSPSRHLKPLNDVLQSPFVVFDEFAKAELSKVRQDLDTRAYVRTLRGKGALTDAAVVHGELENKHTPSARVALETSLLEVSVCKLPAVENTKSSMRQNKAFSQPPICASKKATGSVQCAQAQLQGSTGATGGSATSAPKRVIPNGQK